MPDLRLRFLARWLRRKPEGVVPAEDVALWQEAVAEVRSELGRADAKASMLLSLAGVVAALVVSSGLLAGTGPEALITRSGLALLIAVVVVLLSSVRPQLGGIPFIASHEKGRLPADSAEHIRLLAVVVRTKFRRIRLAVDLLTVAVVVLVVGIAWTGTAQ